MQEKQGHLGQRLFSGLFFLFWIWKTTCLGLHLSFWPTWPDNSFPQDLKSKCLELDTSTLCFFPYPKPHLSPPAVLFPTWITISIQSTSPCSVPFVLCLSQEIEKENLHIFPTPFFSLVDISRCASSRLAKYKQAFRLTSARTKAPAGESALCSLLSLQGC